MIRSACPVKTKKLKRSHRESWCLWLQQGDAVWLVQRPHTGIWSGLWTLPMYASEADLQAAWPHPTEVQPPLTHVLTHFDWRLHLARAQVQAGAMGAEALSKVMSLVSEPSQGDGQWVPMAALNRGEKALPKPFQRWLVGG